MLVFVRVWPGRNCSGRRSAIVSFARFRSIDVKSAVTSKDTIISSSLIVTFLIFSRNCWALVIEFVDPATRCLNRFHISFARLYEGDPGSDTIGRNGAPSL